MKRTLLALATALTLLVVVGCNNNDGEEYKTEGPTATDNPSVGAPVTSGGQPGEAPVDGAANPGKASAPRGRASKN